MADYEFAREFGDTIHSDPDTYNVDHDQEASLIGADIMAAIPGKDFHIDCIGTTLHVKTEEDWSAEDQATLAATIATHKAVDDWPPTP